MASVLLIEPFYTGSHKIWADELLNHTIHQMDLLELPGKFWKWRMHGSAISVANRIKKKYDLFIVSDMVDLALFKSCLNAPNKDTPILLYFHENQLTYPWSERKKDWDRRYAWINYCSALVSDEIAFNSNYNKNSFLSELPNFLSAFPDNQNLETVKRIEEKSYVLPIGFDFNKLNRAKSNFENPSPYILWNHRWEHDKNPELFFNTLIKCKSEGLRFKLLILGKSFENQPKIFEAAKIKLSNEIEHYGFVTSKEQYLKLLWQADILPVTSKHDFFGISVLEAIYCETIPLLPFDLAYPEHLEGFDIFYNTEEEFYQKLKSTLSFTNDFNKNLKTRISKYDWSQVILQYDDRISQLTN